MDYILSLFFSFMPSGGSFFPTLLSLGLVGAIIIQISSRFFPYVPW